MSFFSQSQQSCQKKKEKKKIQLSTAPKTTQHSEKQPSSLCPAVPQARAPPVLSQRTQTRQCCFHTHCFALGGGVLSAEGTPTQSTLQITEGDREMRPHPLETVSSCRWVSFGPSALRSAVWHGPDYGGQMLTAGLCPA